MTDQRIQLLDELGAEFARVAEEQESASRRFLRPLRRATPRSAPRRPALAITVSTIALLSAGAYTVPTSRAAIKDLTGSFAGWVAGDDDQAPGQVLRPADDAPTWVREEGGRLIAEAGGVGLYVTRTKTEKRGTLLTFALGNDVGVSDSIEGWREQFDEHALVVLGPSLVDGQRSDRRGRFPLLGITARSVRRVELRYATGPALVADGLDGGFVLMVDTRRARREIAAYDSAGRELERIDVSDIGIGHERPAVGPDS